MLETIHKISCRTVPDMVIHVLREAILSGKIPGGMQLKQEKWASHFQISQSAFREALKILEAEGLVKIYRNRGAIVTELSVKEAQEIYDIRSILEVGAVEWAIPHLTPEDFQEARQLISQSATVTDANQWGELNWRIHEILYRRADRPQLYNFIRILYNNVERYMRIYFSEGDYRSLAIQEHEKLIAACEQGDTERAKTILRRHILDTSDAITNFLEKNQGVN